MSTSTTSYVHNGNRYNSPMKNLPLQMRPREKLIAQGAQALTDVELLALLLRTGTKGRPVLQMAQEMLHTFGGLQGLLNTTAQELQGFKGLGGTAKRAELTAILELSRRAIDQQLKDAPIFENPLSVEKYLQLHLGNLRQEVFAVLFLDVKYRLIALKKLFYGTIDQSNIYPREVVIEALNHQAHAVILAHNHPSGDIVPSVADKEATSRLQSSLALVDVKVLDHFIIGAGKTSSFLALGLM